MDIRDYEYIVTIAEQKSITRAAAQLFITQSALTTNRTKPRGSSVFKEGQSILTDRSRAEICGDGPCDHAAGSTAV